MKKDKYTYIYLGLTCSFIMWFVNEKIMFNLFYLTALIFLSFLIFDLIRKRRVFTINIFENLSDFFLIFIFLFMIYENPKINWIFISIFIFCQLIMIFTKDSSEDNKSHR
jgi:hypothetical protein